MVTGATVRNRAILLFMVDTGLRASEFTALNIADYEPRSGSVTIAHGKGDLTRTVYAGSTTRISMQKYLRTRDYTGDDPLFTTVEGTRFSFWGLRQVVRRNAERVGIPCPGLHDFRRCCAVTQLRNGMSLAHVSSWLGHQSITVTRRYLALTDDDLRIAQVKSSPVDRWYGK
jgi:site-specific recombinase XerD